MTPELREWVFEMKQLYLRGINDILEIGSLNVNGSVREFFNCSYTGIDMRGGKDVDIVINAHDLMDKFEPKTFDFVMCLETLEHDDKFWLTIANMRRLSANFIMVSTPTISFPYHAYPKDYYRFTKDFYKDVLFKNMKILNLTELKGGTLAGLAKYLT